MWVYEQVTGRLTEDDLLVGRGYSGTGEGRNNPDMQSTPNVGPIPEGGYTIGAPYDHPHLGPHVLNLIPDPANQMFGRTDFRIHGNNMANDASHGCIILSRPLREAISASHDNRLVVVSHISRTGEKAV